MNKSVVRKELIDMIQAKTPVDEKGNHWSKVDCETALDAVINTLADLMVAGDKVGIRNFGTFTISERAAREGVNPKTGDKISIAKTVVPKFKPSTYLKEKVAEKNV